MINIVKRKPEKEGECALVAEEYCFSSMPAITAYCYDTEYEMVEPYTITEVIPGVLTEEDEIIIDHDLMNEYCEELLTAVTEALCISTREVTFGPFNTRTLVCKLKEDWQDECLIEKGE